MSFETYLNIAATFVSIVGATVSILFARKRMHWEVLKELAPIRSETLDLLKLAIAVDNQTWHRKSWKDFVKARSDWDQHVQQLAPIIPSKALAKLDEISKVLDKAISELIGMPLGGLAAAEALAGDEIDREMERETWDHLHRLFEQIKADNKFMRR